MLKYYQELVNECIDINEWKEKYIRMINKLSKMKSNLKILDEGRKMNLFRRPGQDLLEIKQMKETIKLKEREIVDIKTECAEQFKKIRDLCFANSYNNEQYKMKKIHEIASDNFSALFNDLAILESTEDKNEKIIELSNTRQSKK